MASKPKALTSSDEAIGLSMPIAGDDKSISSRGSFVAGNAGTHDGLRRRASPTATLTAAVTGYSGTPFAKKLGIGSDTRLVLVNAPAHLEVLLMNPGPEGGSADVVVIFATEAAELNRRFVEEMKTLPADGVIWCAWPKRASKVPTDITEDRLRELFLPTGMVDNKVAAIDEVWSGLRFVVRRELRDGWNT
ncbi:MAG: DUF3052 domain-containing protein [Acidimicrobiia bacterium]